MFFKNRFTSYLRQQISAVIRDDVGDITNVATKENQTNATQKTQISDASGNVAELHLSEDGVSYFLSTAVTIPHFVMWNHFFNLESAVQSTLNGAVAVNSKTLILADATGFVAGNFIDIHSGATHIHMYRKIILVGANTVTIDAGVDVALADGSQVDQTSFNMAVNGAGTPQVFVMKPRGTEVIHVRRLLIQILDETAMDDGKFGGLTALTNGVHIRKVINGGASYQTVAIWRANKDLKEDMYNIDYSSKAPAGQTGMNGRWTISESGSIINLDATNNEWLECIIQDDLTGLIDFQIKAQGHFESF